MRNNCIENIQKSLNVLAETRKAKISHGCFFISLLALGAQNTHCNEIHHRPPENQQTNIEQSIRQRGLEIVGIFKNDDPDYLVTDSDIRDILQHKDLEDAAQNIAGHLFILLPEKKLQKPNHAFAVIPRYQLPDDIISRLEETDRYVVVNATFDDGCREMNPGDIAQLINDYAGTCEVVLLGYQSTNLLN